MRRRIDLRARLRAMPRTAEPSLRDANAPFRSTRRRLPRPAPARHTSLSVLQPLRPDAKLARTRPRPVEVSRPRTARCEADRRVLQYAAAAPSQRGAAVPRPRNRSGRVRRRDRRRAPVSRMARPIRSESSPPRRLRRVSLRRARPYRPRPRRHPPTTRPSPARPVPRRPARTARSERRRHLPTKQRARPPATRQGRRQSRMVRRTIPPRLRLRRT